MADVPIPVTKKSFLSRQLFRKDVLFSSKILGLKYGIAVDLENMKVGQFFEDVNFLPRASLVSKAVIIPRLEDHIKYMKTPGFDPRHEILLTKSTFPETLAEESAHSRSTEKTAVAITHYEPNNIKLISDSADNSYLLLSELLYPGWRAKVDGKNVPILRADYLLRAIPLPPGQHKIEFSYKPLSFIIGSLISLLSILTLTGIWILRGRIKGKVQDSFPNPASNKTL